MGKTKKYGNIQEVPLKQWFLSYYLFLYHPVCFHKNLPYDLYRIGLWHATGQPRLSKINNCVCECVNIIFHKKIEIYEKSLGG